MSILQKIVETKMAEVARLAPRRDELRRAAESAPPPRDFRGALTPQDRVALIAEIKRRSPGAGEIRAGLDPAQLAEEYARSGASALSVLTDGEYFGGSLDDLKAAREACDLPALRKDFVLDPVQIFEARAAGADAVLLIVRILDDEPLRSLRETAESLGMGVLVEAHSPMELERALASGAGIVGINNRDLATFQSDVRVTIDLVPSVPGDVALVSESGIRSSEQVDRLGAAGVNAILVGETLLRAPEPGTVARELSGRARTPR